MRSADKEQNISAVKAGAESRRIKKFINILMCFWSIVVAASALMNIIREDSEILRIAVNQGRAIYHRDAHFRRWSEKLLKAYGDKTDGKVAIPYFHSAYGEAPVRNGDRPAMIDPGHVMRRGFIMSGKDVDGVSGRVVSLRPAGKKDEASEWELAALRSFEKGAKEKYRVERIGEKRYLRYMRPFIVEKACLGCHTKNGYREGEARGALSVLTPLASLEAVSRSHKATIVAGHIILWFLGVLGLCFGKAYVGRSLERNAESQEALRRSENMLRLLTLNAQDGVYFYNMERDLEFVSPAAEILTGYSPVEMRSRSYTDIIFPEDRENVKRLMEFVFSGKSFTGVEYRISTKDGRTVWCSSSWGPALNEDGLQIGVRGHDLDITKKKRAELALRESEERYRLLAETTPDMHYILDRDGKALYVNRDVESPAGFMGGGAGVEKTAGISEKRLRDVRRIFETGETIHDEETMDTPDGVVACENRLVPMRGEDGEIVSVLGISRDTTMRRRTESMLRLAVEGTSAAVGEEFFRSMVRSLAAAMGVRFAMAGELTSSDTVRSIAVWDGDGFGADFNYSLKGTPFEGGAGGGTRIIEKDARVEYPADELMRTMNAQGYVEAAMVDDGGRMIGVLVAADVKPLRGEMTSYYKSLMEIFAARAAAEYERKKVEDRLKRSERRMKALSRNMIAVRESERAALARELHDELGQKITGLFLEIECLRSRPDADLAFIETAKDILKNVSEDLKRIYHGLRPVILDKLGVGYSLESLLREFRQRSGVAVEESIERVDKDSVHADVAISFYRILQEVLNNVAKHSKARKLSVTFRREGDDLVLEARDDGVGFRLEDAAGDRGFGLLGMRERAELFAGTLDVWSAPGEGVRIRAALPMRAESSKRREEP